MQYRVWAAWGANAAPSGEPESCKGSPDGSQHGVRGRPHTSLSARSVGMKEVVLLLALQDACACAWWAVQR